MKLFVSEKLFLFLIFIRNSFVVIRQRKKVQIYIAKIRREKSSNFYFKSLDFVAAYI